jgi:hypothetical protein
LSLEAAGWEDAKVSQYSYSGAYELHEPVGATQGQEGKISNLAESSEEFMLAIEEIVMTKGAPRGCNRGEWSLIAKQRRVRAICVDECKVRVLNK